MTEDTKSMKPHMESIQQIFDQLKNDVTACVSTRHTCYSSRRCVIQCVKAQRLIQNRIGTEFKSASILCRSNYVIVLEVKKEIL